MDTERRRVADTDIKDMLVDIKGQLDSLARRVDSIPIDDIKELVNLKSGATIAWKFTIYIATAFASIGAGLAWLSSHVKLN